MADQCAAQAQVTGQHVQRIRKLVLGHTLCGQAQDNPARP
jgi:hypothetical protein